VPFYGRRERVIQVRKEDSLQLRFESGGLQGRKRGGVENPESRVGQEGV